MIVDSIKSKYITNSKNPYQRLSEEYINIALGIDEMIKNSNNHLVKITSLLRLLLPY